MGSKAHCQHTTTQINMKFFDVDYLLKPANTVYTASVLNVFDHKTLEIFKYSFANMYTTPHQSNYDLDPCFNTILDEPLNPTLLIHNILEYHSLKPYVIDSLQRIHSLLDVTTALSDCARISINTIISEEKKKRLELFRSIVDDISKHMILVCTIESLSCESQRFIGNYIRKNDLPIPFAYYIQEKTEVRFKINFNILMETFCFTNEKIFLLMGSSSAIKYSKTNLLLYIFSHKRSESFISDENSQLRFGCIDTIFSQNDFHSYAVFDVHGTINKQNEDIITAIQCYCSVQILCVTEADLEDDHFLRSTLNYSKETRFKPTIVVIFDPTYTDQSNTASDSLCRRFEQHYAHESWSHVRWITAPIVNVINSSQNQRDQRRGRHLCQSFKEAFQSLHDVIDQQCYCESILSIQTYFLDVQSQTNVSPAPKYSFTILEELHQLFDKCKLTDKTNILSIITPITYIEATIQEWEKKLKENWQTASDETHARFDELRKQYESFHCVPEFTQFFIDLLINRSFIELLVVGKYLEQWRSQYHPKLIDSLTDNKHQAMSTMSCIKELEVKCEAKIRENAEAEIDNIRNQIKELQEKFKIQQKNIEMIDLQIANVDITVELFYDEILSTYERIPRLFQGNDLLKNLVPKFINLMRKGFPFHLLRGRPLRCHSELIKKCLTFIQKATDKPPFVITVIGAQSSAKSSLLNVTFGSNFRVSAGRCTIGMYLSIVHWKSHTVFILDTEGLLSLEESGSIFDNQMVSLATLCSHLVLINHKGDLSADLEHLIGMSFYAKVQLKSVVKPHVLFVLRDKRPNEDTSTFFRQLANLKETLYHATEFLKSSIDEELMIDKKNIILLPDAFSQEINPCLGTAQYWRNQAFPLKILDLRRLIMEILERNNPENLRITIYNNLADVYDRIASSWEAIDVLGPNLLACKKLQELAMLEELRKIAACIIDTYLRKMNDEGRQRMKHSLAQVTSEKEAQEDSKARIQFLAIMEKVHETILQEAQSEFDRQTERSCYEIQIKEKVHKTIEPPLRFIQILLREEFEEHLYNAIQDARISNAQQDLLQTLKNEFDQNLHITTQQLLSRVQSIYDGLHKKTIDNLKSQFKTPKDIERTVLKFYNATIEAKTANPNIRSTYNLLRALSSTDLDNVRNNFKDMLIYETSSFHASIGRRFAPHESDQFWKEFKHKVAWFSDRSVEDKTKKQMLWTVFKEFIPELFEHIEDLISRLNTISDSRMINYIITYIENLWNYKIMKRNEENLQIHAVISDLAILGVLKLIQACVKFEERRQKNESKKISNELDQWKERALKQVENMHDSYNQGQNIKKTIAQLISNETERILLDKILDDLKIDITISQFINHKKVQEQAYEESFRQANGEKIMKYVLDINRYFLELSLREIKSSLFAITYEHTLNLEQLIIVTIKEANNVAQRESYSNVRQLADKIENNLRQMEVFKTITTKELTLKDILDLPIKEVQQFKNGFNTTLIQSELVKEKATQIIQSIEWQAFRECKDNILRRLGCQVRCPGCGSKCSRPEPHGPELVQTWPKSCKCKSSDGKCNCILVNPVQRVVHESSHHIMRAFHGHCYYEDNTPDLSLCYQRWTTTPMIYNDTKVEVFPIKKYYNQSHPEWFNNLDELAREGPDRLEDIAPSEQRMAWMVVRSALLHRYSSRGMVDHEKYDRKLFRKPANMLPHDFEPKWNDEELN